MSVDSGNAAHWKEAYERAVAQLQAEAENSQKLRQELQQLKSTLSLPDTSVGCPVPSIVESPRAVSTAPACSSTLSTCALHSRSFVTDHGLNKDQAQRYSRHLLLPNFGVTAQVRLCHSSILVVGCGGLGSPVALYLAAAGVGTVGLADGDQVDSSNLHRQIIHTEERVGMNKAVSAAVACRALNSLVKVEVHPVALTRTNALALVAAYDLVVDATDNPATRYLISDACVVQGKPLVSAAAVGTDGQISVYNWGEEGPCYRCLFPECPAPQHCSRCGDAGVLGVVPGVLGCLQALEAIKVVSGAGTPLARKLLLVDALEGRVTSVRLRGRSPQCVACGEARTITAESLPHYDYEAFTGQAASDGPLPALHVLGAEERLTPQQLQERLDGATSPSCPAPLLLDVRPTPQWQVMHLSQARHVPYEELEQHIPELCAMLGLPPRSNSDTPPPPPEPAPAPAAGREVIVMCRRGNLSQLVVRRLQELGVKDVKDVVGGYTAYAQLVALDMPVL